MVVPPPGRGAPPDHVPSGRGASVTSRALAILGAFDERHRVLTLTELSKRAGLPLTTTHRLVGELRQWGALARTAGGSYSIGRRIWDLGILAPVQRGLVEVASPYLHDVFGATRATVHLGVRDGLSVLYLDRLGGTTSVPIVSTIGSRLPLHTTAVGKVLLAHAPVELRRQVLSTLPTQPRPTPYSITQPGLLRRQLAAVLDNGYATTSEEMSLGACSIAVPICDRDTVVAALGIVVPSLRGEARLVTALRVAANSIGRELTRGAAPGALGEG
ncbi:IclR family transcriptional regulator [Calidifontibacter sp. DB0510]|uniref:IclR family transcriptional regulator n=1 Tax=Metallococcus carri TaxID=1656884 RepID=A0A967B2D1_9MICO|nr:IclR family transcriptional regulator [Metallococcus carri]NHN56263.1 IclR family transcriptional regulator [Metallococcus carri]NOP38685.1 IclR family transcriptional regulator [Calidifontibacter sp. DB2511S]